VNRKLAITFLLISLLCTGLFLMPEKPPAVNYLASGFIAESGTEGFLTESSKPAAPDIDLSRWDLWQIKAPEAWSIVSGGQDVTVAVLDTGIDDDIEQLKGKVIQRTSFTTSTGVDDINGHGTAIAGIIAGAMGRSNITGLAYNCSLLDVQVAEDDGSTDAEKVARGIIWAVDQGARVINVSIVIAKPYALLDYAVDYAWRNGCMIVAAAGNTCSSDPVYPAACPHVMSVAASDKEDNLARWSNHGDWVTVAAPGVDIYSACPGNKCGFKSGSSFSTALTSGEAALLYPRTIDINNNGRINDEIAEIILNNADGLATPDSPVQRINVYKAALAASLQNEGWQP
jgi:thermitase